MYQVRNGQQVVPTCDKCGCRLREIYPLYWGHFQTEKMGHGRDAKGHTCSHMYFAYVAINEIKRFYSTGPHWNPI